MIPSPPPLSPEIVFRAQTGCPHALNRLFRRALVDAHRLAHYLLRRDPIDGLDEDNLVQESVIRAYRSFRRFRGSSFPEFEAWIRSILWRSFQSRLERHERRFKSLERIKSPELVNSLVARDPALDESLIGEEEKHWVLQIVSRLAPRDRDLVIWRVWEGLGFREIAVRLRCSENAATVRFHRIVSHLATLWRKMQQAA